MEQISGAAMNVKDFLEEADLMQYFESFRDTLKVTKTSQLKFVVSDDLVQIGMSKPEQRRYKKTYTKNFPNSYFSKIKRLLGTNKRNEITQTSDPDDALEVLPFIDNSKVTKHVEYIIHVEDITINKELGMGQFGVVQQGTWTTGNQRVQVAIKCLGNEQMTSSSTEFLKEAAVMHSIDHPNIVRLYGVVLHLDSLMLVTELAPLRSLLECLSEIPLRPNFPVPTLCDFAEQICDGMTYLENKRLIHRDLAARNILVFTKDKVKISDFGLSRALGVGKDYYQTNYNVNLKLPVAWCAPECILYLRFTSASDVWAYGVCLWEMFTYGFQPWAAFSGQQILENIDAPNYQRLERPECCPQPYYNTMLECWSHDPQNRPKFKELAIKLQQIRPEQVQTIVNSQKVDGRRSNYLEYKTGDIITVLSKDKDTTLWSGVLAGGACGIFDPGDTKPYTKPQATLVLWQINGRANKELPIHNQLKRASSLSFHSSASLSPSLGRSSVRLHGSLRSSLLRSDTKRHTYTEKRSIDRGMISSPQGDVKHTGHIGLDGAYFGDVSFLDATGNPPRQVVTPYKPSEDLEQQPLINPNSPSHLTGASSSSLPYPLLRQDNNPRDDEPVILPTNAGSQLSKKESRTQKQLGLKLAEPSKNKNKAKTMSLKRNKPSHSIGAPPKSDDEHEYHEISDNNTADTFGTNAAGEAIAVPESPTTPKSQTDFSQSLLDEMDTMFRKLDSHVQSDQPRMRQYLEENRSQTLNKIEKKKALRTGTMKPMSAQEQKTLDTAVALANEITTRSMNDLGKDTVKLPASPNDNKTKFNFKRPSRSQLPQSEIEKYSQVKHERRNFSKEANSVPDIQSTLTKESKLAYASLIEQPAITTSLITHNAQEYTIMSKPPIHYPKPAVKAFDQAGIVTPCVRSSWEQKSMQPDTNYTKEINVIPLPPRSTKPKLVDKARHFRKYPLVLPETAENDYQINLKPAETSAMRKIPSIHNTNIYHNFSSRQYAPKVMKYERDTSEKVQYLNLTDDTDFNLGKNKENGHENKTTDNGNSNQVAVTVHENKTEKEALVRDCTDHVSVEDLLEFVGQKPCGRQRGLESDEVRIMCKVLKHEATPEHCLQALELSDWNVHEAIKTMRVKISIGDKIDLEECNRELSACNGDVLKTLSILVLKYPKKAN